MAVCILLIILWLLYSFAMVIFLGYLAELPPTPLFETLGLCSGFVLATAGWIGFSCFVGSYLFGCL